MAEPFDANTAGNAEEIEMQFAVKTVEHLEVGTSHTLVNHKLTHLSRRTKKCSRLSLPSSSSLHRKPPLLCRQMAFHRFLQ